MPEINKIEFLIEFKQRDKFSNQAWEARGLNPSSTEISSNLSKLFDRISEALITVIQQNGSQKKLKNILTAELSSINKRDFDTEEKEFICDLFYELAQIAGVDLSDSVSRWLYGTTLSTFLKIQGALNSRKRLETISQQCANCGILLETFIIERQEGIPDNSWSIVRCKKCNDYSLISVGPNVKEYHFGNYDFIERLPKENYSKEQAEIRLQQVRHFRK